MWLALRPAATVPLWHDAQLPVTWLWSTRVTGRQAELRWQDSQELVVAICVLPRPAVRTPSWQLAQFVVRLPWSKAAGSHAEVLWQVSQLARVAMCPGGLPSVWTPL
ncbi:MAG: hypothetical protein EPO25_11060 [Gammaproteobacteria bacterium]|nr:MAG: hypothetical protein EPO25_11060 [Gammaproteobacteria bacterium]